MAVLSRALICDWHDKPPLNSTPRSIRRRIHASSDARNDPCREDSRFTRTRMEGVAVRTSAPAATDQTRMGHALAIASRWKFIGRPQH